MKYFFAALLCFFVFTTFSQNKSFTLTGTVISQEDKSPLESATVYLERIKDTTLVTYTITDKNGRFEIEERTPDDSLQLNISYVGFASIQRKVAIDSEVINLGSIEMSVGEQLDEVVIRSRAPITIKRDTLEFNVKSFKTKKDATVEDLLKKLPGVEVDEEGKITVNGKEVNKILVNGKPFFGDDPTITTRNLTKEIIEKVQVTDTKTDAEAFAGEDSDGQNKTINLTIKEENNKGVFGRVAAGGGTDERYEFAGFFNRFDNDQRISILAGGNNINSAGFSFGEIRKMFGGGSSMSVSSNGSFSIDGRSFGGGSGITSSRNAGANYADSFGKALEVSADYFYGGSDSEDESSSERENFLPEGSFFTNTRTDSRTENDNQNLNMRFDIKVDSTFLINVKPSLTYGTGKRSFNRDEESLDQDNVLTNQSVTDQFSENTNRNFRNVLDLTKRFGSKGASMRISMTNEYNKRTSEDFINSTTEVFGTDPSTLVRDQFTDTEFELKSFFLNANYKHPLIAEKLFLNASFSHRDDIRESLESTFDFDEDSQSYSEFNNDLSTNFSYTNRRTTPGLGLNYQGEKLSANIRGSYVFRTLSNDDTLRPETTFEKDFGAVEANAYINYRLSPKTSLYANYSVNNTPPQIEQLQPFQDVSNPLNIVTGNPNLEPSNNHQLYVGYNNFDFQKRTGLNFYGGATINNNQPTVKTLVDENFVSNTTFENVDGNYNGWGGFNYSKDIKLDTLGTTLKYNLGFSANLNRAVNFFNGEQYNAKTNSVSPNINLTFTWPKVMEIIPSYRINFSNTRYSLDNFEELNFTSHNVGIETATFLPKKFEWRNDIEFRYNPNVAPGFQRSAWFWNSTLSYSVLKDKGLITLKVYDLLNQNTNARRSVNQNFIQDSQSLVLRRYAMLSFSWKFNSLGSKGKTDDGGVFFFN